MKARVWYFFLLYVEILDLDVHPKLESYRCAADFLDPTQSRSENEPIRIHFETEPATDMAPQLQWYRVTSFVTFMSLRYLATVFGRYFFALWS
jgi:hypothetical protein